MLKNGQTYFKNLVLLTLQYFESMVGHFYMHVHMYFFNIMHEGVKVDHVF